MIPRIMAYLLFQYKYFVQAYIRFSNYIDVLYLIYVAEIITSLNIVSKSKLVQSAETKTEDLFIQLYLHVSVYI